MSGAEAEGDTTMTDTDAVRFKMMEEDGRVVANKEIERSEACDTESMVYLALLGRHFRVSAQVAQHARA